MNTRLLLIAGSLFLCSMLLSNVAVSTGHRDVQAGDMQPAMSPLDRIERQLDHLYQEIGDLRRRLDRLE